MSDGMNDRSRAAIRRVLAIPADQLPPGPNHPTQACPECSALIPAGRHELDKHKTEHRSAEQAARRRRAAANRRNAAERLRRMNEARRNPAPPERDLERDEPAPYVPPAGNDDAHQEHDPEQEGELTLWTPTQH